MPASNNMDAANNRLLNLIKDFSDEGKRKTKGRGNFGFRASKYGINQEIKLVLSPGFQQDGYFLIASRFRPLDL